MNKSTAIGIDLGTTFSTVAVYEKGRSNIIANLDGDYLTPSLVFYDPSNIKEASVGTTANDKATECIENFLYDMKRIIGRKYDDVYVQKIIGSENYKFCIVRGKEDQVEIKLQDNQNDAVITKLPEEVCSEILKHLKKSAEQYLGCEVQNAVISVPAYFSNAQRKATKEAAKLAGLNVLKLVTEPVAAAIHYSFYRLDTKSSILVFDWGGGTLDVSIIQVCGKSFEVKSVEGDTFLGGRDFDEIILKHFLSEIKKKFKDLKITSRLLKRISDIGNRIKIKLSTEKQYCLLLETIAGEEGKNYMLSLTREKFEDLAQDLFKKAMNVVEIAIKNIDIPKESIDDVILVGGCARIPKIQELLTNYFDGKRPKTNLNPDEAVALGAALQACIFTEKDHALEIYKITEVTPLSLGYRLYGDLTRFVIKKNTPLPTTSRNIICETSYNNQTACTFTICEGERKNCKYNNILGHFIIKNLPAKKIGVVKFKLKFSLDEDGILTVTAKDTKAGNTGQLVVTIGEFRLCENKIKEALNDAEKNKEEDDKFEKFVYYLCDKKRQCSKILYDIKKLPDKNQVFVKQKCEHFLKICDSVNYEQFDELQTEYFGFTTEIKPMIKNYIDINLDLDLDAILDSLEKGDSLDKMLLNKDFLNLILTELDKISIENKNKDIPK